MAPLTSRTTTNPSVQQLAPADLQFGPIVDDDLTPSEDEPETPEEDAVQLETVQSAIGVSIGQQQTHLTSPKTPAAEKAAALDETDGSQLFDGWEEEAAHSTIDTRTAPQSKADGKDEITNTSDQVVPERGDGDPATTPERLPSPWRAGPKTFHEKSSDHRAVLRQHLQPGRPRASSGGAMTEAMRKYMPFNLSSSISRTYKDFHFSLPSFSALSLDGNHSRPAPSAVDRRRRETITNSTQPSGISQHDGAARSIGYREGSALRDTSQTPSQAQTAPISQREFGHRSTPTISPPPTPAPREQPVPKIRRSNSEGSLLVYRTRSFASSLGDDTRFESVQEQVNSRLKAIRDSWQDSSFKLPSPSFPNFNFGSREELFKIRNGNTTPKARDTSEDTTQRVTFRTAIPTSTSRTTLTKTKPLTVRDGNANTDTHPFFTQALHDLEGDLVVLGGYRGSILRSAEPPNRQLWVPIKVGLNLRKVDLEVPLDPEADERMEETIYSSGMLTHIGPVDISKRLFKRLRACDNVKNGKLRVHDYGYDWRLSPHYLSRRMIEFLEKLPCNQPGVPSEKRGAVVLAHSLGGLITRHVINQRPELVAGVVYAGVPQRCVNILGPFRNGDDVLFSSRVLTAQVNFSIRTSYVLLPLDGKCFINKHTKEEYPVDFFDANTWKEHRLSPCIAAPLPRPEPPKDNFSVSGLMSAVSQALPTFQSRKGSFSLSKTLQGNSSGLSSSPSDTAKNVVDVAHNAADKVANGSSQTAGMEPHMSPGAHISSPVETSEDPNPATDITIPYDKAIDYLTRVLAETKAFKEELAHNPAHTETNAYPPIALIYGKSTPTVYGAKVESREAIKRADVYDELAFASGDGVVLARAAMVPDGYSVVRGGVVSSDRGHVTLLGDLEAVGRCLQAVIHARRNGVGLGEVGKLESLVKRKSDGLGIQAPISTSS